MINLRTVVLTAAIAALPFAAMAASTDTSTSQPAATAPATDTAPATPTKHAKKPVHHVSHKTTTHKKATTNTQS